MKELYVWEVAGKPLRVEISFDVVERIVAEADHGMRSPEPSGSEVGGILLGTVTSGDNPVVSIHSIEPVSCEYAYGPTFILTERDEQRLSTELARRAAGGTGLEPVGFFRSHTRGNVCLSEQDLWLFATHFSSPHHVALIVKPRPPKPPVGGFFFWENGTIKSDGTYKEFPLDLQQLRAGTAEIAAAPVEQIPESGADEFPLPFLSLEAAEPAPAVRKFRVPGLTNPAMLATVAALLLLGGGVLGFAGGLLWRTEPVAPPAPPPYGLSLSVAEYGDNLHLRWNRGAPAIAGAVRGLLSISDGESTRPPVELGRDQLRKGSVIYRRVSPNVKMRLEVFVSDRDSVAEVWARPNG